MSSSVLAQRCFPAPPRKSRATHNCETRRRKQAGGQCQGNVARQCCDQDWKQGRGEQGNAETLQKLTQVFDMLSHYTIPTARRGRTFNSRMDDTGKCPREAYQGRLFSNLLMVNDCSLHWPMPHRGERQCRATFY